MAEFSSKGLRGLEEPKDFQSPMEGQAKKTGEEGRQAEQQLLLPTRLTTAYSLSSGGRRQRSNCKTAAAAVTLMMAVAVGGTKSSGSRGSSGTSSSSSKGVAAFQLNPPFQSECATATAAAAAAKRRMSTTRSRSRRSRSSMSGNTSSTRASACLRARDCDPVAAAGRGDSGSSISQARDCPCRTCCGDRARWGTNTPPALGWLGGDTPRAPRGCLVARRGKASSTIAPQEAEASGGVADAQTTSTSSSASGGSSAAVNPSQIVVNGVSGGGGAGSAVTSNSSGGGKSRTALLAALGAEEDSLGTLLLTPGEILVTPGEVSQEKLVGDIVTSVLEGGGGSRRRKVKLTDEMRLINVINGVGQHPKAWEEVFAALEDGYSRGVNMTVQVYRAAMAKLSSPTQPENAMALLKLFDDMRRGRRGDGEEVAGAKIINGAGVVAEGGGGGGEGGSKKEEGSSKQGEGQGPGVPKPDKFCYHRAIDAHLVLQQRAEAVELLLEMRDKRWFPSSETPYVAVLKACAGDSEELKALRAKTFGSLGGCALDTEESIGVCTEVLQVMTEQCLAGQGIDNGGSKAIELIRAMQRQEVWPNTKCFNSVVSMKRKEGRWEESHDIVQEMRGEVSRERGSVPNQRSYAEVIFGCLEAKGDIRMALGMHRQMKQDMPLFTNSFEMTNIYLKLIDACYQDRRLWKAAVELFNAMRKEGLQPTYHIYGTVVHILTRGGEGQNWEAVYNIFQEAKRTGRRLNRTSALVAVFCMGKAGQLEKAIEIFRDMPNAGVVYDIQCWNDVIEACSRSKDWRTAMEFLKEMERSGIVPNGLTYHRIVKACARDGEWQRALALIALMKKKGIEVQTADFNAAMLSLCKAKKEQQVTAILENLCKVQEPPPNAHSFQIAMVACQYKEDVNPFYQARLLFDRMKSLGLTPRVSAYCALMSNARLAGEPPETVLGILEEMKSDGVEPNEYIYSTIIATCANNQRLDLVDEMLYNMKVEGVPHNVVTYTSCMLAAKRSNDLGRTTEFWHDMKAMGISPDAKAYGTLISAYRTPGRHDKAMAKLKEMTEAGIPPNLVVYTSAMSACEFSGEYDVGMTLFEEMLQAGIAADEQALGVAVNICNYAGWYDDVDRLMGELTALQQQRGVDPYQPHQPTPPHQPYS